MRSVSLSFLVFLFPLMLTAQVSTIPVPSKPQLDWHEQEFYMFVHFGPNTFTDKEWGHGDEPASVFNPTDLDCRQWARIAKQAGAKAIIITAKHHDGFCLWPSKYSKHTVKKSKWKNGKGDVLRELSEACREFDLKFGVYISPWDRNHPDYGTPKYNDVFVNMMKEIFSNYGPIWELWWDGANGEGPNGKRQVYDWDRFKKTIAEISPNTVIFSDVGPHIRWVGNERGIAGETNWNNLDTVGFTPGIGAPHVDTLNEGNRNGKAWIPAECDVSIRPGWFYHSHEDNKVKTPNELFGLYLKSVGRGANLLLNVPPDRRGLIHERDSASLIGFRELRNFSFAKDLVTDAIIQYNRQEGAGIKQFDQKQDYFSLGTAFQPYFTVEFKDPTLVNCIAIKEWLNEGQKIDAFYLEIEEPDKGSTFFKVYTTIGRNRIITFPTIKASKIRITIMRSKAGPAIRKISAFLIDEELISK